MTAERIASLRRDLIAQSTGDQAKERNELCDLAAEALRLRPAMLQAVHDLGCLAASLQMAAPGDPMVPFGYRMTEAARAALAKVGQ